jgi:hypothetical protein
MSPDLAPSIESHSLYLTLSLATYLWPWPWTLDPTPKALESTAQAHFLHLTRPPAAYHAYPGLSFLPSTSSEVSC